MAKVLRIIARLNVGGPARQVIWLSQALENYQNLLVTGVVPPGEDDMSYLAAAAGLQPLVLPEMSREVSIKDALTTWKLFRLMLRERPDIVHTHTAKAGTVGRTAGFMYRWVTPSILLGKPRPVRFVHTYHGHVFHSYYGPIKTRLFLTIEKLLASAVTDRIVVISEQQRREINEVFRVGRREQFAVVPLGIDISAYAGWRQRRSPARAELNANESDILIGIVGRLTEIKNHRLFLDMATRLKTAGVRARFLIIGDGHLRSALEAQVKSLGLSDNVTFLGNRRDPENFYPALDIVALTSLNEGTPLTLIEAMANARPIVATTVGGVGDLLGLEQSNDGSGYLIRERGISCGSGDAEGFSHGLRRLIDDQDLRTRLGSQGLDYVTQHYSRERLLGDISELYAELLPDKSRVGAASALIEPPPRNARKGAVS